MQAFGASSFASVITRNLTKVRVGRFFTFFMLNKSHPDMCCIPCKNEENIKNVIESIGLIRVMGYYPGIGVPFFQNMGFMDIKRRRI
jgi:hypothetical protein